MKLFNKKPKTRSVPRSTVDLKMQEYGRLYSRKATKKGKFGRTSMKTNKKKSTAALNLNGATLVETSMLDGVEEFFCTLQEDLNDKTEVVAEGFSSLQEDLHNKAKVVTEEPGDESFNRNADTVVQMVDDCEEKLTMAAVVAADAADQIYEAVLAGSKVAYIKLTDAVDVAADKANGAAVQGKISADNISEVVLAKRQVAADRCNEAVTEDTDKVNKAVEEVQVQVNEGSNVASIKLTEAADVAADKTNDAADRINEAVLAGSKVASIKLTEAADVAADKANSAAVRGKTSADNISEAVLAKRQVAADRFNEAVMEATDKANDVVAPVEEVQVQVDEAVEGVTSRVQALTDQMGSSVRNFIRSPEVSPMEENAERVIVEVGEVSLTPNEGDLAPIKTKMSNEVMEEEVIVATPEDEVEKEVNEKEIIDISECATPAATIKATMAAKTTFREAHPLQEQARGLDTIFGEVTDATLIMDDSVSLEPSIESIMQDDQIFLAFMEPVEMKKVCLDIDGEGEIDISATVYDLSLMIDGAVVETLALSAVAARVLTCSINTTAEEQRSINDIIICKPQQGECAIKNDFSFKGETPNDFSAINNQGMEEQTFIHPMILAKMNGFLEQTKEHYEQISEASGTACGTTCGTILEQKTDIESTQRNWFDTSVVLKKQISSLFGGGSTTKSMPSPDKEDNRNECHDGVNPVSLHNDEVRQ